jgi:DNA modification methylase
MDDVMTNAVLDQHISNRFAAYNADTVEFTATMPDNSVGLSVYSPPFSQLYVYSESERDMGNVADHDEFAERYRYLVRELLRVTKPGRISAVHCSDLPTSKQRDGVIGLFDLPGLIRQVHEDEGWVYHSRVTIWKCPVVEMTRTKAHGLLYKTLRTDGSRVRVGMPDYLMVFRKESDGKTPEPVTHDPGVYPVSWWQEAASPVWTTIDQTDVLNVAVARDDKDERHLCPLQLDVIERAVHLWSNTDDLVYSPFMGIGSEGYVSIKHGRRFAGTELKPAYFKQAVRNLKMAEDTGTEGDLVSKMVAA